MFPYFDFLQQLVPFPKHRILHFRRRATCRTVSVHSYQAVGVPYESSDDECKDDDQKQRPVCVGKALHLGRRLVDACRLGEFMPGLHLSLVAFLVRGSSLSGIFSPNNIRLNPLIFISLVI